MVFILCAIFLLWNIDIRGYRSSRPQVFQKTRSAKFWKDLQGDSCAGVFFVEIAGACNFIKQETQAQVFSREFREISQSNLLIEHLWTATSEGSIKTAEVQKLSSTFFIY